MDEFTFYYYDFDHLGNVRQVTEVDGSPKGKVVQTNNYYPFGTPFYDEANTITEEIRWDIKPIVKAALSVNRNNVNINIIVGKKTKYEIR